MTISEYTREKYARRLRAIASLPDLNWPSLLRCLGVSTRKDAVLLLAEMVEAGERTCRSGVKTIGQVFPDGFDFDGEYTTVYIFPLSCGHEVRSLTNRIPRFCPDCGARVIQE